jgi:hypothetical protein
MWLDLPVLATPRLGVAPRHCVVLRRLSLAHYVPLARVLADTEIPQEVAAAAAAAKEYKKTAPSPARVDASTGEAAPAVENASGAGTSALVPIPIDWGSMSSPQWSCQSSIDSHNVVFQQHLTVGVGDAT